MTLTNTQSHQKDLSALLRVLSGETSEDVLDVSHKFIQSHPDRSEGYFILGVVTYLSGYIGDAISMIEKAHDLDPDIREYALALSGLYIKSERLNDALYFAKLGAVLDSSPDMAGILPPDLNNFIEAAEQSDLHSHFIKASLAFNRREFDLAIAECVLELKMDPTYVPALDLSARAWMELGEAGHAVPILQKTQQLGPENVADTEMSLAEAICHLGLFEQAQDRIEAALKVDPDCVAIGARAFDLLSLMPNTGAARTQVLANLKQNGLREEEPYFPYTPSSDGKIRIGFLSDKCYDCFEGLALSHFVKRLDMNVFEPYIYIQNIHKDGVTQTIINRVESAREVFDINDKTLSLMMQRDEIDILIDMCGFGKNQRLSVLAHQPCGLRVSWLATPHGGGQPGIDVVVADGGTVDVQTRFLESNQDCMQLEGPLFSVMPIKGYLDPVPPPVVTKGFVTFGIYLDFCALSGAEGMLWARLLDEVANSKLRIHVGTSLSEMSLARLNEIFEPLGLLDRIELHTPNEDERMGGFFDGVDIFLASKFSDVNHIIQSLWMGVPCLVQSGIDEPCVTLTGSVLRAAGIPSWVCEDDQSFLALGQSLAFDHQELAGLRTALRQQVAQSALMNVDNFTMEFQSRLAVLFLGKLHNGER